MALHMLVMAIGGAGTQASPRAPKYASSFDGTGWCMCDGGSYCTVLADLSATALTTITGNVDVVEIPFTSLGTAPTAAVGTKLATIMNGTTVSGGAVITVPGGATAGQMARLALEYHQPALVGHPIKLAVLPAGTVTL